MMIVYITNPNATCFNRARYDAVYVYTSIIFNYNFIFLFSVVLISYVVYASEECAAGKSISIISYI